MALNEDIKTLIDASVDQPTEVQIDHVEKCVVMIYHHVINGYQQSRECIQFSIGQLERVHMVAVAKMILMALDSIDRLASRFSKSSSPSLAYYNVKTDEQVIDQLMKRIQPDISGMQNLSQLKPGISQKLTLEERRQLACHCVDIVQTLGLRTNWDGGIIIGQTMLMTIMYSICKYDNVMDLFFIWNNNISDRLNTSSQRQLARDYGENLLMIGYQERMIAEAYFCASRAYIGAKHVLGGLLYLNVALLDLQTRNEVQKEMAFEIIWQMLKIMRDAHFHKQDFIDKLLKMYDGLGMDDYKTLSVYHTAFGIELYGDIEDTAKRIEVFLCDKRDVVYSNMEHSAVPWYTLIRSLRQLGAIGKYPVMDSLEGIMKAIMLQNGNENIVRFYDEKEDKSALLMEELAKLETTRNPEDIGLDSHNALVLATDVLEKAVADSKPADFILAMRPKSDFSFAMTDKKLESDFKKVDVVDPKAEECDLPYGEIDSLAWLLQTEKSDCVMWIGKGNSNVFRMTLLGNMYKFDELSAISAVDADKLQKETISKLVFSQTERDRSDTIYTKNELELKTEAEQIYLQMKECTIAVPNIVNRIFFVKDMALSAIPHQLMIDERTGKFVGESCPSANVISTEFLIKSNFNDPLPKGYNKSYWSPLNKETTFWGIKEGLKQVFEDYQFDVDDNDEPAVPLHADLNIVCAHGADNISDSEWFYAGGTPIVNSKRAIGPGKVLVLFVCHSGSITHQYYDHTMHTIIKRYLRMGYSSVVAPMWSLNTEITKIWLPVFMEIVDAGGYMVDAVFQANMEVKKQFITPSAWACLHLFGNPYMKIADKPILIVE